jgi:hypothetical protein
LFGQGRCAGHYCADQEGGGHQSKTLHFCTP